MNKRDILVYTNFIKSERQDILKFINPIKDHLIQFKKDLIVKIKRNIGSVNHITSMYVESAVDFLIQNEYYILTYFREEYLWGENFDLGVKRSNQFIRRLSDHIIKSDEVLFLTKLSEDTDSFSIIENIAKCLVDPIQFYLVISIQGTSIGLDLHFLSNCSDTYKIKLMKLPGLESIHLRSNSKLFLDQLRSIKSLKNVYLEDQNLYEVPELINNLNNIEFISLRKNNINLSHDDIILLNRMDKLTSMDISHNNLDETTNLKELENIELIDITFNPNLPHKDIEFSNSMEYIKIGPLDSKLYEYFSKRYNLKPEKKVSNIKQHKHFRTWLKVQDLIFDNRNSKIITLSKAKRLP